MQPSVALVRRAAPSRAGARLTCACLRVWTPSGLIAAHRQALVVGPLAQRPASCGLPGALTWRALATGRVAVPEAAAPAKKKGNEPKGPPKKRKRERNLDAAPLFRAAIVGRPNVGKSTLFNRLVGKKMAIVHDTPGVTRDRREAVGRVGDIAFTVFDTAGLEREIARDEMRGAMFNQTEAAVLAADVVLFVIDAREGITGDDEHFARWLRKKGLPVVLVANKCEGDAGEAGAFDSLQLGFGHPIEISAEHGEGMAGLFQALLPHAERGAKRALEGAEAEAKGDGEEGEEVPEEKTPLELAIVGQPNVGKSTILNRLLGQERVVVSAVPGTTRDAVAVEWSHDGRRVRLVDTAGLRRPSAVTEALEGMAWGETRRAIDYAHVTAVVVDAREPLAQADLTIAQRCTDEGRPVVLVANKTDLVADRAAAAAAIRDRAERSLPQVRGLAVVPVSALTGDGVPRIMPAVVRAYERWCRRVPTSQLNRWLERATSQKAPPIPTDAGHGVRIKIRYMTQVKARPPTFALFFSKAREIPETYVRYLANSLREEFDLAGVPLRIHQRPIKSIFKRRK